MQVLPGQGPERLTAPLPRNAARLLVPRVSQHSRETEKAALARPMRSHLTELADRAVHVFNVCLLGQEDRDQQQRGDHREHLPVKSAKHRLGHQNLKRMEMPIFQFLSRP